MCVCVAYDVDVQNIRRRVSFPPKKLKTGASKPNTLLAHHLRLTLHRQLYSSTDRIPPLPLLYLQLFPLLQPPATTTTTTSTTITTTTTTTTTTIAKRDFYPTGTSHRPPMTAQHRVATIYFFRDYYYYYHCCFRYRTFSSRDYWHRWWLPPEQ